MQTQAWSSVHIANECGYCNKAIAGFLILLLICPIFCIAQNTKLIVGTGTSFIVSGNNLLLRNTDLQCNGVLDASNGTVIISGNNNSSIGGTGSKKVQTFTLNTSASTILSLLGGLTISGSLNFQNGIIDLTNQQLTLSGNGVLQGESETSHTISTTGGTVTTTKTGIVSPNQYNGGNLGASITSAANLGNITITRSNKPAVNPDHISLQGIQRTYLIQAQNNTALNATLRFYYLNAELNGNTVNTLSLWKSNNGIAWTQVGADVRNAANKYVEKSGISDFSYWTLSGSVNPLPLTLTSFKVTCDNNSALVIWQTGTESDIDFFEVERSEDGINWIPIQKVLAINNANGATYTYNDKDKKAMSFYRLKIIERSGIFSYSPIFKGGCADIPFPFGVYPNPVSDQTVARISVRQPCNATIQIYNMQGQLLASKVWNLQPGFNQCPLHFGQYTSGTYIIKLLLPDTIVETSIIKQ